MNSLKRYGSTALVTGASSGIGKSYARAIASDGLDLVLVARRKQLLDELAEELGKAHGVKVHTIAQDLSEADAADRVLEAVTEAGLEIDILVNNAGYGSHGVFDKLDLDNELAMINLSCRLPVALTSFMPDHGHGSNSPELAATGTSGEYSLEIDFIMAGYWELTLEADCAGTMDTVEFKFCIEG